MRLLNTRTLQLEEFGGDKSPQYAILSHTWGADEVTFQDLQSHGITRGEERYSKIEGCCKVAAADGFDLVWIDTCCIDKTSSSELSEAINSMYHWYQEAEVCYAYLADVLCPDDLAFPIEGFSNSRWFTRGWTLQELIAPSTVVFFSSDWQEIGTKGNLPDLISKITGIHPTILMGESPETVSVAQRMSWASKRKTTRIEDLAYCLMGLFGINMPMLYGEGEQSFIRLEEEIMKITDDHSIFAWRTSYMAPHDGGILATSPKFFADSGNVIRCDNSKSVNAPITISNIGDHLNLPLEDLRRVHRYVAVLNCRDSTDLNTQLGIHLRDVSARKEDYTQTKQYFLRERCHILDKIHVGKVRELPLTSICVLRGRSARKKDQKSERKFILETDVTWRYGYVAEAFPPKALSEHLSTKSSQIKVLEDGSVCVLLFRCSSNSRRPGRDGESFAVALRKRVNAVQSNLITGIQGSETAEDIYISYQQPAPEDDSDSYKVPQFQISNSSTGADPIKETRHWQSESSPIKPLLFKGGRSGKVRVLIKRQLKDVQSDNLAIPAREFGIRHAARTEKISFDVLEIRLRLSRLNSEGSQMPRFSPADWTSSLSPGTWTIAAATSPEAESKDDMDIYSSTIGPSHDYLPVPQQVHHTTRTRTPEVQVTFEE